MQSGLLLVGQLKVCASRTPGVIDIEPPRNGASSHILGCGTYSNTRSISETLAMCRWRAAVCKSPWIKSPSTPRTRARLFTVTYYILSKETPWVLRFMDPICLVMHIFYSLRALIAHFRGMQLPSLRPSRAKILHWTTNEILFQILPGILIC